MTYFENFNLAPYTVTPAQSSEGKLFMFFGTIPQELTFYGPAPVATFTPVTVRISIPDEEDDSITLTPKSISNNVMASPTTSPKRRRRPSKKTAPTAAAQVTHNSQAPGRGPWMHTKTNWWLGQPFRSPTNSQPSA
jgi:hypothetical protein